MIRTYDPKVQRLRGLGFADEDDPKAKPIKRGDGPLHPFYWAGFLLVGDGR